MKKPQSQERLLKGINASPGICIGKAYHVDREGVEVIDRYALPANKVKSEIKRFKTAVQSAKHELRSVIENSPPELQKGHILETHVVLLNDKLLYGRTIETIEKESVNAEWALKTVVNQIMTVFHEMPDTYLKERMSDITHLTNLVMRHLTGAKVESIGSIDKRVVLVAHDLSAADTSQINLERIKGFITDLGGKTSHTGIIARSLEIPAVVGLETATREIQNDDIIIVDGTAGVVIARPSERTLLDYEERQLGYERYRAVLTRESHLEAKTPDGVHIDIMGNIELPEEVVSVLNYGGDGIGLFRTEFQYLNRTAFPSEDELFESYKDVIEVMAPRAVTFRTLDINGDKAMSLDTGPAEANPALGLRAIRYCLRRPEVFKVQLRAILRAAALGEARIIFPMISIYYELLEAKRLLDEAAESLEKDGLPYRRDIPVGIMVEVPSAVVMADLLAREVNFFSIGTNDLIQYTLAIDRGNRQVSHLYQPLDPAVLRLIKHTADVGQDRGIKVCMCGEMASYPLYAPLLLGMGFDELSMNPAAIPVVKRMVRAVSVADSREAVKEVLKQPTALKVLGVVRSAFGDFMTNHRQALKA